MEQYFTCYAEQRLGHLHSTICWRWAGAIPNDSAEPFNMAYLAMRGSGAVNGVSRLHGEVSRRLFQPLFPRWPEAGGAGAARDQRRSRAHLGIAGSGRSCGRRPAARSAGWADLEMWSRTSARSATSGCGSYRMDSPARLIEYARKRLARQRARRGRIRRGSGGGGADFRFRHSDAGLRAALRHLQAAQPAAARSGAADAHSDQSASGRCS